MNTLLLSKFKPNKKLLKTFKEQGGRNNNGRITVAHRGGGHKQLYRNINFNNNFNNSLVINVEYDPFRSARIINLYDNINKKYFYRLASENVKILDNIIFHSEQDNFPKEGNSYYLEHLNIGDFVHNVELIQNKKGQIARSAGNYAQILAKNNIENNVTLLLPSGEQRKFSFKCKACFGKVSNQIHKNRIIGKAGRSRWLNKRPSVRGVAMNPVDHPHGGGQGKTSGGRPSVTPWGIYTKGTRTRNPRKKNPFIVSR